MTTPTQGWYYKLEVWDYDRESYRTLLLFDTLNDAMTVAGDTSYVEAVAFRRRLTPGKIRITSGYVPPFCGIPLIANQR